MAATTASLDYQVSAAGGIVDFSSGRKASPADAYAWGSGTKPLTGASIFNLISQARCFIDPIEEYD